MYGTKVVVHCPYVVSFIYIIKQDIHIYVAYCRPNGWYFLWTLMSGRECQNKNQNFFHFQKRNKLLLFVRNQVAINYMLRGIANRGGRARNNYLLVSLWSLYNLSHGFILFKIKIFIITTICCWIKSLE